MSTISTTSSTNCATTRRSYPAALRTTPVGGLEAPAGGLEPPAGGLDAAHDAEGKVKDHLAISLVLSLGLGMLVGYFIHRSGSE